jgi:mRNA interferase MazF
MRRGEVYRVHKPGRGPQDYRALVIVSRQVLIESRFSAVICAPVFSSGEGLSTQVEVGPDEGLQQQSWIMCDNLIRLRKIDLTSYIGSLTAAKIAEVDRALKMALDLP